MKLDPYPYFSRVPKDQTKTEARSDPAENRIQVRPKHRAPNLKLYFCIPMYLGGRLYVLGGEEGLDRHHDTIEEHIILYLYIISNRWLGLTGYKNFNVKIERIFNGKNQIILKVKDSDYSESKKKKYN